MTNIIDPDQTVSSECCHRMSFRRLVSSPTTISNHIAFNALYHMQSELTQSVQKIQGIVLRIVCMLYKSMSHSRKTTASAKKSNLRTDAFLCKPHKMLKRMLNDYSGVVVM